MKLAIIVFVQLILVSLLNADNKKQCDESYKEIWQLYKNNLKEEVNKQLEECSFSDGIAQDSMGLLRARLYYEQHQYQETIETINQIKSSIEIRFEKLNENSQTEQDIYIRSLYYLMIEDFANVNYMLGNYEESIKYYTLLVESKYQVKPYFYEYLGFSFYHSKEYNKALDSFEKAFSLYSDNYKKMACAYNVSAIYSKNGVPESSLKWFKIAMYHNLKNAEEEYFGKIYLDGDFVNLRNSKEFMKFKNTRIK